MAEPKERYVEETRSLTAASRSYQAPREIEACGMPLTLYPTVFDPSVFFSSCWFAEQASAYVRSRNARSFCEIGCGSGIVSVTVGADSPDTTIVACDLNPEAVRSAEVNLARHGIRAEALESDVYDALGGRRFDVIFWALPFGYLDAGERLDLVDAQTFDPGYRAIDAFFRQGREHLTEAGRLLFGFSPELGDTPLLEELAAGYGWTLRVLAEHRGEERSTITMQVYEATP